MKDAFLLHAVIQYNIHQWQWKNEFRRYTMIENNGDNFESTIVNAIPLTPLPEIRKNQIVS